MSLYSDYVRETGLKHIIEREHGFATYHLGPVQCYIEDIYVTEAHRKTGLASQLADHITEIAKAKGCKQLLGSVNTQIKDPTSSMKTLLAYGFKFMKAEPQIVWFVKDIT